MDVLAVDGDVSHPSDDPAVDRPFELPQSLDSSDVSGDVGLEKGDIEKADVIGHEKISLAGFDVFTTFRTDPNEKDFKKNLKAFFDPSIKSLGLQEKGNKYDQKTEKNEI
jgi:hypothetical protein